MAATDIGISPRPTLGIISGSGPEAGLDLWQKILEKNQSAMAGRFRGDLDAPRVVVLSEPVLGLSMELERNEALVWAGLRQTAAAIAVQVEHFAIACNTLNWFAPRIEALGLPAHFLSFQSVIAGWLAREGINRVGLLGAASVTALGAWSPYAALAEQISVETTKDAAGLHALIYDVKRLGSADPGLRPRLKSMVEAMEADTILLACTELPLISNFATDKRLIDVTGLVADALVACSLPEAR